MKKDIINTLGNAAFIDDCQKVANEVVELLREKNLSYGNSLQNPIGIFAKGDDRTRLIRVRIDDKLARFARGNMSFESEEDTIKDLLGYLIPLLVIMRQDASEA